MMKQFFEQSAKKVFSACGLKVNKMGLQRTTFAEVLDHVVSLDFRPSVVIDVGVALQAHFYEGPWVLAHACNKYIIASFLIEKPE
jgi:hypothetical protein